MKCFFNLIVGLALLGPTFVAAQEEKAPAPEVKEASAPKAESSGEEAAKYAKIFEEFKQVIKDLRKLKTQHSAAKPEDAAGYEQQWTELVAKGNQLIPQLREAGKLAYEKGETKDPQLERFLIKLASDAAKADDFEPAYALCKVILDRADKEGAPAPKELYNVAGVCAFNINDYDAAEKYLTLAKESGTLKDVGNKYLSDLPKYKDWYAKELEIEKKESEANDLPRVKVSTDVGDMVIELFENEAPETVGNFISLVEAGFYDGLTFHRVLPAFMAQGGDPKGSGSGGPGYSIYCETDKPDFRRHFRGTLSMAHAGKDTGGSQFFLCFTPQEGLDGKHTGFGRVIEGLDVLSKIQRRDPNAKPPLPTPTKITKMEVVRKRDHKYQPRKVE